MLRKSFNIILISTALTALAACNTVRGAGEDVKSVADSVDRAT